MRMDYRHFPKLLIGLNRLKELDETIVQFGGSRVIVITEPIVKHLRLLEFVENVCSKNEMAIDLHFVSGLETTKADIEQLQRQFKAVSYDVYIGIGNEATLNATKILAGTSGRQQNLFFASKKTFNSQRDYKMLLIPTTVTSGMEVTSNVFIYDRTGGVRKHLSGYQFFPTAVLYDPLLTLNQSPYQIASSSMVSLASALEFYLLAHDGDFSIFSLKAIKLLFNYILRATFNNRDFEAREAVLRASMLLGLARSIDCQYQLMYSFAKPIEEKLNISYEIVVAVMLPYMFHIYRKFGKYRKKRILEELDVFVDSRLEKVSYLTNRLQKLAKTLGFPSNLALLGIQLDELPLLSKRALSLWQSNPYRAKTRVVHPSEFRHIYENAYSGKIESPFEF